MTAKAEESGGTSKVKKADKTKKVDKVKKSDKVKSRQGQENKQGREGHQRQDNRERRQDVSESEQDTSQSEEVGEAQSDEESQEGQCGSDTLKDGEHSAAGLARINRSFRKPLFRIPMTDYSVPRPATLRPHFSIGSAVVDQPSFVTVTTYRRQPTAAPGTKWTWKSASSGLR